jgi:hypothetical protein
VLLLGIAACGKGFGDAPGDGAGAATGATTGGAAGSASRGNGGAGGGGGASAGGESGAGSGGALQDVAIPCAGFVCGAGEICCGQPSGFSVTPAACAPAHVGCLPVNVPLACNDSADCPSDAPKCCAVESMGTVDETKCATGCESGGVQLCSSSAECGDKTCVPYDKIKGYSHCD